jgi:hypothetical protein
VRVIVGDAQAAYAGRVPNRRYLVIPPVPRGHFEADGTQVSPTAGDEAVEEHLELQDVEPEFEERVALGVGDVTESLFREVSFESVMSPRRGVVGIDQPLRPVRERCARRAPHGRLHRELRCCFRE